MGISNTTLVGIIRIVVIVACLIAWLAGKLTVGEAALAMGTLAGAAGSVGFIASQDAVPSTPNKTTDAGGGKL